MEFAQEKTALIDKRCTASDVKADHESLLQLILLEDCKNTLPETLVMCLNEQKVATLSKTAILADEFMLTYKTRSMCLPGTLKKGA